MPKISLSGPAELLTAIPFHLGFQPERSVVVVCFHGRRLGLVARLDLVPDHLAAEAAAQLLPTLLRDPPSSVALVGYEDERDEALPLLTALAAGLEAARVLVRERLLVRDGRWHSVGCDCCPGEGRLLPELADVPAVASYVALGHAVLPDRAGLGALVEPLSPSEPRHDLTLAAIEDWQRRYAAAGGCVADPRQAPRKSRRAGAGRRGTAPADVLDGGAPTAREFLVNDALMGWGGVLHGDIAGYGTEHWLPSIVGPLRDVEFRDAVVGWLCQGSVPLSGFPAGLVLMLEVFLGNGVRVPAAGDEGAGDSRDGGPGAGFFEDLSRPDDGGLSDPLADLLDLLEHRAEGEMGGPGEPQGIPFLRLVDPDDEIRLGDDDDLREPDRGLLDDDASGSRGVDGLDGLDGLDGGDGGWEDWEEAAAPRLLLARLEEVCRLTPAEHAAPLLAVVASFAWWMGDGARAGVAVDRALELEPDHRLSLVVRASLDHGLRPRRCA